MIRHIPLFRSKKIEVYCTPAVEREMPRKVKTFVKACIAAEKTLINSITRKYPDSKDRKFTFIFKKGRTDDTLGSCDIEYDGDVQIDINALQSVKSLYTTIAHELVHARQFISGKLTYNVKIKYHVYEGVKHRFIYRRQPWEIEAYELQDKGANIMKRWLLDHVHYNPKLTTPEV